jgi:hypothetical protein
MNTAPQSIQIVQINDLQQLNWRNMGMVPLQTMFVASTQQQKQQNQSTTSTINNNNNNNNTPMSIQTLKTMNGENVLINNNNNQQQTLENNTTFKLINGNCLSNGVLTQNGLGANIYSLDSETGTLKPLLIAAHQSHSSSNETQQCQNGTNQFQLQNAEFSLAEQQNASSSSSSTPLSLQGSTQELNDKNKEALTVVIDKSSSSKADDNNSKVTTTSKQKLNRPLSLEEMSLNELREECIRRNLPKSGRPKQKLIERIREHMLKSNNYQIQFISQQSSDSQQQYNRQLSVTKSPDSGVNMDGSPSFMPCKKNIFSKDISQVI